MIRRFIPRRHDSNDEAHEEKNDDELVHIKLRRVNEDRRGGEKGRGGSFICESSPWYHLAGVIPAGRRECAVTSFLVPAPLAEICGMRKTSVSPIVSELAMYCPRRPPRVVCVPVGPWRVARARRANRTPSAARATSHADDNEKKSAESAEF